MQAVADYDMGISQTAQVKKQYVLGVHNDSNVSVPLRTLDLTYVSAFYTLKQVKGRTYAVFLSSRGFICGLAVEALVDGQKKTCQYIAKNAVVLEEEEITLKKGECLRKLVVSYTDNGVMGFQIYSETQKVKIGELDRCEYTSDMDFFERGLAIVGFDVSFNLDRIVELSLFTAPIQQKGGRIPLTKPYLNGSSFALVNEDFYMKMKQKNDENLIKSAFKESKEYRRMQSL